MRKGLSADFTASPILNMIILLLILIVAYTVFVILSKGIKEFFEFICIHGRFDFCAFFKSIASVGG